MTNTDMLALCGHCTLVRIRHGSPHPITLEYELGAGKYAVEISTQLRMQSKGLLLGNQSSSVLCPGTYDALALLTHPHVHFFVSR